MSEAGEEPRHILRIGVISDTHGLLRPEAVAALRGTDHILHAGDTGDRKILEQLREIAPLTAVRGNIDRGGACSRLPEAEAVTLGSRIFYMLHDRYALDLDPAAAGFAAVVSGHSHHPGFEWQRGVLYFNPGSAGPRRFSLPVTVGQIRIVGGLLEPEIIHLFD